MVIILPLDAARNEAGKIEKFLQQMEAKDHKPAARKRPTASRDQKKRLSAKKRLYPNAPK